MSDLDPATLLNQLVENHWATAARHAWRQYEKRGRGVIVFPVEEDGNESERTPLRYLTFNESKEAQEGPFSKLYDLVQSYNPEQEIVAAAVLPDDRTVFDVYAQKPEPPEA